MVKDMKPGSVIIDLAAAGGGNCTMTKPGEIYTTDNGVIICGLDDLPGRMASQASNMYSKTPNAIDYVCLSGVEYVV
jgi:H+-translocating NAD(P) transhydrogenase subunit alpha